MRRLISANVLLLAALWGVQPLPAQGRPTVAGNTAAVSSDHPLASAAGAEVLRRGGNAFDAAITMAGVLAVVRPHMNGLGGDAFMIVYDSRTSRTYALNGSGRSGSKATPQEMASRNLNSVPSSGIVSVSVPGAVAAWADMLQRFGTITLREALAPAIHYAENGFTVSPVLAADLRGAARSNDPAVRTALGNNGTALQAGAILKQPDLARSLRTIAERGAAELYTGELGRRIGDFIAAEGGLVTAADMAQHKSTWVDPIETSYQGIRLLAFPPNTQGVTTLQMANIAENFDFRTMGQNSGEYVRVMSVLSRLAYADRDRTVADPEFAQVPVAQLLSKTYARQQADMVRAGNGGQQPPLPDRDGSGDTVYLCVVDKDGNAVSQIQSLFAAMGSGRMVPGTGILLHNRGSLFELDAAHPNIIAPHKRPYHTLNPMMVLDATSGRVRMVLGSPGGDGQPQTVLQMLNNVMLFDMFPQQAVDAPRFRWNGGTRVWVEPPFPDSVRAYLTSKGLQVTERPAGADFGGAQMIWVHPVSGARIVGSDFRRESYGIAW
jgi:gamma-glutamyltranspeptidase/glutathione hydrolase